MTPKTPWGRPYTPALTSIQLSADFEAFALAHPQRKMIWKTKPVIIDAMKPFLRCLFCVIIFGAAACAPQAPIIVPTAAELPTLTPQTPTLIPPSPTQDNRPATALLPTMSAATETSDATPTDDQTLAALIIELTLESAELATAASNATSVADAALASGTPQPTETITSTQTETRAPGSATYVTFTPSATLDVTYTPAPTRTATSTGTQEPQGLELLALLSAGFTVLPPEIRYNPATQTALALAVTNAPLTGSPAAGLTATSNAPPVANTTPTTAPIICAVPPPIIISNLLSAESALLNQLGCPIGGNVPISAASQTFQNGSMMYLAGTPGDIYTLTNDGRFRRYPDTWVSGVDPDSAGLTPPPGLIEPIRGFGKVWRTYSDAGAALGWATTGENGATATLLLFERGRAIYLPPRNETVLLIPDVGTLDTGVWRSLIGSF